MIRHQAIGDNGDLKTLRIFSEESDKVVIVFFLEKDSLLVVSPVVCVIVMPDFVLHNFLPAHFSAASPSKGWQR